MFAENVTKITPITEVAENGEQRVQFSYPANSGAYDDVLNQTRVNGVDTITVVSTYSGINLESASSTEMIVLANNVTTKVMFGELPSAKESGNQKTTKLEKRVAELENSLERSQNDASSFEQSTNDLTKEVESLKEDKAVLELEIEDLKKKLEASSANQQSDANNEQTPKAPTNPEE